MSHTHRYCQPFPVRFTPYSYRNTLPLSDRPCVAQHAAQDPKDWIVFLAETQFDDLFAGQHQGGSKFGVRLLRIGHRHLAAGQRKVFSFSEYPGVRILTAGENGDKTEGKRGLHSTYTEKSRKEKYRSDQIMLNWHDVLNLAKNGNPAPDRKIVKTEAEWRARLSPEQYRVTRDAGTERPFSSEMCSLFEPGIYSCLCCETILFNASEKFESGTGWPSFTQPLAVDVIAYRFDGPAFLKRVETICSTCDAHLGHVFPDGPSPSGLRYCMNAVALKKTSEH